MPLPSRGKRGEGTWKQRQQQTDSLELALAKNNFSAHRVTVVKKKCNIWGLRWDEEDIIVIFFIRMLIYYYTYYMIYYKLFP